MFDLPAAFYFNVEIRICNSLHAFNDKGFFTIPLSKDFCIIPVRQGFFTTPLSKDSLLFQSGLYRARLPSLAARPGSSLVAPVSYVPHRDRSTPPMLGSPHYKLMRYDLASI